MSHVAKAQKTTDNPAISPRVASTIGAESISTIRAPATTVIATAPIDTQYGGSKSLGSRSSMIRSETMIAEAA